MVTSTRARRGILESVGTHTCLYVPICSNECEPTTIQYAEQGHSADWNSVAWLNSRQGSVRMHISSHLQSAVAT